MMPLVLILRRILNALLPQFEIEKQKKQTSTCKAFSPEERIIANDQILPIEENRIDIFRL
jgi:hypothetical protein